MSTAAQERLLKPYEVWHRLAVSRDCAIAAIVAYDRAMRHAARTRRCATC